MPSVEDKKDELFQKYLEQRAWTKVSDWRRLAAALFVTGLAGLLIFLTPEKVFTGIHRDMPYMWWLFAAMFVSLWFWLGIRVRRADLVEYETRLDEVYAEYGLERETDDDDEG